MSDKQRMMYVRFLGTGVCWTVLDTGGFYIGSREEANEQELALCVDGGGELPLTESIRLLAALGDQAI